MASVVLGVGYLSYLTLVYMYAWYVLRTVILVQPNQDVVPLLEIGIISPRNIPNEMASSQSSGNQVKRHVERPLSKQTRIGFDG